MNVQAIQAQETNKTTTTSNVASTNTEFSSYLNTSNTLDEIFTEASVTYGVPKDLLKAIAKAESNFDPNATSRCGAQGIMQLMPATAKSLGVTDAYDPYQNIMGGAKYISEMLDKYDGNVSLALAAYNAGPNNVSKYGGIPPFEETQNYVAKVTGYMQGGVSTPNVSYSVSGTRTVTNTPVVSDPPKDSHYENSLNELFSYDDYMRFLELYMKIQDSQNEEEKEAQENTEKKDSYYSYQEIKYNPAVLNLMSGN